MKTQNTKITITREHSFPNGTEGKLVIEGAITGTIFTLEEPWKNNQPGISCIPKGIYRCIPHGWESGTGLKQKRCWEIIKVPNRSAILIHSGNTIEDIEGCCLVGLQRDTMNGLPAVLQSRNAMALLREIIGLNSFDLVIQGV